MKVFDTSGQQLVALGVDVGTSNTLSVLSNAVSVLSNSVSALSNATSVLSQSVSALSNQVSVLSQAVSVLSQAVSAMSNTVSAISVRMDTISNANSVNSQAISVLSQAVSVLSQAVSALSQAVSALSQALSVLSNRVSANSGTGGGGQTTYPLGVLAAVFPTDNFPQLIKNSGTSFTDYTLDFDATSAEAAYWVRAIATSVPTFTSAICEIWYRTSALSGTFAVNVITQTRGSGNVWDTTSAITAASSAVTVPATSATVGILSVALTVTGWAAGRVLQVKIERNVSADTAAADIKYIDGLIRLT